MWISDFAIRNRVVTVVLTLALVVFGAIALLVLRTDEFPEVNPPVITVALPYPGATPEGVERDVIDPLEEAFAAISGVDEITSSSSDGFGLITVIFLFDKELQQASPIQGDLHLRLLTLGRRAWGSPRGRWCRRSARPSRESTRATGSIPAARPGT